MSAVLDLCAGGGTEHRCLRQMRRGPGCVADRRGGMGRSRVQGPQCFRLVVFRYKEPMPRKYIILLAVALAVIVADQWTKFVVVRDFTTAMDGRHDMSEQL